MANTSEAGAARDWSDLEGTAYSLDIAKIRSLPLRTLSKKGSDGNEEVVSIATVGEAIDRLKGEKITAVQSWSTIETSSASFTFDGPVFSKDCLGLLADLRRRGIAWGNVALCWYETDDCLHEPLEGYRFFLAQGYEIFSDSFTVYRDTTEEGFDPSVLQRVDADAPAWGNESAIMQAHIRYLYRKFYTETPAGQEMLLRRDEPTLYHYEVPAPKVRENLPIRQDVPAPRVRENLPMRQKDRTASKLEELSVPFAAALARIQWLLWVVVLLLIVHVARHW